MSEILYNLLPKMESFCTTNMFANCIIAQVLFQWINNAQAAL